MKLQSYTITQGRDRAPARAMLKGIGFTDEDLAKPIIGVANTWIETMPCNFNLRELAIHVKAGIRAAGICSTASSRWWRVTKPSPARPWLCCG